MEFSPPKRPNFRQKIVKTLILALIYGVIKLRNHTRQFRLYICIIPGYGCQLTATVTHVLENCHGTRLSPAQAIFLNLYFGASLPNPQNNSDCLFPIFRFQSARVIFRTMSRTLTKFTNFHSVIYSLYTYYWNNIFEFSNFSFIISKLSSVYICKLLSKF